MLKEMVNKYNGPKIGFVISGGGCAGVASLGKIPGASKVIYNIAIPYSYEAAKEFITTAWVQTEEEYNVYNSVSKISSISLAAAACEYWGNNIKIIACTAAITTNRFRKGNNHAWVSIIDPGIKFKSMGSVIDSNRLTTYHFKLDKLSETEHGNADGYIDWKRRDDDQKITDFILEKIFNSDK